ncbi:hypothetical protein ABZ234_08265 [Nocardiopsis sp. NPDC006198]|uniref:hypothetical protein n=1 Tax=Nocardiopsis sp. NPDC006198 TaxID=3154472 RepID=UPI0033B4636D
MPLTAHEAQIRDLTEALEGVTEFTAYDNEGRPVTARRRAIPYIVWDFSRPDGRRARIADTDRVKIFKLVLSVARHGTWPSRMTRMPEFTETAEGEG